MTYTFKQHHGNVELMQPFYFVAIFGTCLFIYVCPGS